MVKEKSIDISHIKSLLFLSGLSGAGRSTALDAVADLGFFINDNLPVAVCEPFLEHTRDNAARFVRTALAPEVDSSEKVDLFLDFLNKVGHPSADVQTIFLEARTDTIVRRYGQTRRPHPCFDPNLDLTLEDTIERERKRLFPIRDRANLVIDTSELNLHELRKQISAFVASLGSKTGNLVRINLIAFGFPLQNTESNGICNVAALSGFHNLTKDTPLFNLSSLPSYTHYQHQL